jgi:hypothetical protein
MLMPYHILLLSFHSSLHMHSGFSGFIVMPHKNAWLLTYNEDNKQMGALLNNIIQLLFQSIPF